MNGSGNHPETLAFAGASPDEPSISDLEAILMRQDLTVAPLRRKDRTLFDEVPGLGLLAGTTGKVAASCVWIGTLTQVAHFESGTALHGSDSNLFWLESSCQIALATFPRDTPGRMPSLMFFGDQGELAYRITPMLPDAWESFRALVDRHLGCANCLRIHPQDDHPMILPDGSETLLREAWLGARSAQDLDLRVEGMGLTRFQAVRALEGVTTTEIPLEGLRWALENIVAHQLPVHLEVGNGHCTQALRGTLANLNARGVEWRVQAAGAAVQLLPDRILGVWGMTSPGENGERYRIELYDEAGDRVLVLACPRAADPIPMRGWEQLQVHLKAYDYGGGL